MALDDDQLKLLSKAAKILNQSITFEDFPRELLLSAPTWNRLDAVIRAIQVERDLQRNTALADELFNEAAEAFADFHEAASDVEVNPPSDEEVERFKEKLRALHEHVQAGHRLETAATFAGALADLIESAAA